MKEEEDQLKKDLEAKKIREWEEKFDEEQKMKLLEEKKKDEKIKRREQLTKFKQENNNQESQDELFSKLESFEIDETKKN